MVNRQFTTPAREYNLFQNNGGLNSTASPLAIADNEATDLSNIDLTIWGAIKKRKGYLNRNSSAINSGASCTGIVHYKQSDGTQHLVSVFGDTIYKSTNYGTNNTDITGSTTITAGNNNKNQFKMYLDTLLATNDVDQPWKWTGSGDASAWTTVTSLTRAKCLEVWYGFVFLANVTISGTSYRSRVYWGDPGTIDTFDGASWIDVDDDDGDEIISIKALGDKLVIFKENSIHVFLYTGDPDVPFVRIKSPSHVGCISRDSVVEVINGFVFQSYDGYYYFDGSNSMKISLKVDKTIIEDLSPARYQYSAAIPYPTNNQYICSVSIDGNPTNDKMMLYDYATKSWTVYDDINANCMCLARAEGEEKIYFGDYDGYIYQMNVGVDDYPKGVQTAISAYYKTKWFNFGDIINQKAIPNMILYGGYTDATLTIGFSYDFEDANQYTRTINTATGTATYGSATYGTSVYAGSGGFAERIDLSGRGRVMRIVFENNSQGESFSINGFGLSAYGDTGV